MKSIQSIPSGGLLDVGGAAEYLSLSKHTLNVWRSAGRYDLPYVKVGSKVRYRLTDLDAFISRRTKTHTGEAA